MEQRDLETLACKLTNGLANFLSTNYLVSHKTTMNSLDLW